MRSPTTVTLVDPVPGPFVAATELTTALFTLKGSVFERVCCATVTAMVLNIDL
jgi:hypothetical protein